MEIGLKFEKSGIQNKTIEEIVQSIGDIDKKHIPFAMRLAVNRVAELAIPVIKTNLNVIFDRPTPWTLNSLRVRYATKNSPIARVEHKDMQGKGTPASKYLRPNIEGGMRSRKSSERQWSNKIGQSITWTPSRNVALDASGNVPAGLIRQMLAATKSHHGSLVKELSKVGKKQRKNSRANKYFIRAINNAQGKKPGIYENVTGGGIRPILFFNVNKTPIYNSVYDMTAIVQRVSDNEYAKQFLASMDYAISTNK